MTYDNYGNNYVNENEYIKEMSLSYTYGSLCELIAAAQVYPYYFEVYREGKLYIRYGSEDNPVIRLRFTGNLSGGHFDIYEPCNAQESTLGSIRPESSRKRRARLTPNVRRKQINIAAKKYAITHPEVHRAAVASYQKSTPEVHRAAVSSYQKSTPEVHRAAVASYQKSTPEVHRAAVSSYQKSTPEVHRAAVASYQKSTPEVHRAAVASYQKSTPEVHRAAVSSYQKSTPEVHRAAVASYQKSTPEVHRAAVASYQKSTPEVHRAAVSSYQKSTPEVHRAAVASYQKSNPDVHRAAVAVYQQNNPDLCILSQSQYRERQPISWRVKLNSAFEYNPEINYEKDKIIDLGKMSHRCSYCNALKWKEESVGLCCSSGKVQLDPLEKLPDLLDSLIMDRHPDHKHFVDNIRKYNGCFQMTSFGATRIFERGFMPTFKVQGQVYHLVGSLLPPENNPQFLQIYFVGEDEREVGIRCQNFPGVKSGLVKQLQRMLHEVNAYVKQLKSTIESVPQGCETYQIVIRADRKPAEAHSGRFNEPSCSEVALVIVGQQFEKRDIILKSHDNKLQRISELHKSYDTLQYPLMFCRGEDGYSINIALRDPITKRPIPKKTVSAANFYAYRLMIRSDEDYIFRFRSLFSQYLVDMYAKIETERLNYIRSHQKELRSENYIHLRDAVGRQDANALNIGQMVVLPSTFTGGPRYMHEKTQDAMTYVRNFGRPDLFITFTCNPKWQDIANALLLSQKPYDRHDIIGRVFHLKIKKLMALLTKGNIFGKTRCYMYSVEWQKRGLPHVHILLWLDQRISPNLIDEVVCAEIPNLETDPILYDIVKNNMIHGPCGAMNSNSPCMKDGKCTKKYPRELTSETQTGEDGYPKYRRRAPYAGGFTLKLNDKEIDNRWVVPYNPVLLRTFGAHMNVEICNSVKSIKYICKYVNKGSDQAAFSLESENDEVAMYECGRYISSSEAVWRILCFPIHERYPPVFHLAVHLENGQRVYYTATNVMQQINNPPKTTLLGFFELCKSDEFAKTLLYSEVPQYYVWKNNKFERRKRGKNVDGWVNIKKDDVLGRVYTIHPNNSECFYLRLLLHVVKGPTSYLDLKTVNGETYPNFQSTCLALGLLEDDKHWDNTLEEAAMSDHPIKLRDLFVVMLKNCQISNALILWEKHKDNFSEDIKRQLEIELQQEMQNLDEVYNRCLIEIEDAILLIGGHHLTDYGLPTPRRLNNTHPNTEYIAEINYDVNILQQEAVIRENSLTDEQQKVYDQVMQSVENRTGQLFFLDAPGGTGKTFLLNLLLTKVRSHGNIALAVASSGIAATLLEGGKTAHATFKIPLELNHIDMPLCKISKQSNLAQVLRDCKLIVWDESTMAHKGGFEALNRTLQDIKSNNFVMGGITVLLAGDFRQTLPVVPRGTRADEVKACLKSSHLWHLITKISLKKNMRVYLKGDSSAEKFSEILLKIGNGEFPNVQNRLIVPVELGVVVKSLAELIEHIYPDIANINTRSNDWLCERAILTPKNERATIINNTILQSFDSPEMEYLSIDSVVEIEEAVHYPVEFLNSLNPSGFPPHKLTLKIGTPVMLLRNFRPPKLCNGTRLRVKTLQKNVIEATVLTGCGKGESVFIPRIPLKSDDYPFEFKRLQFPLKISFAITINKSQGQSLKVAGVDLNEDCFSHGQFYVACSRVSSATDLFILTPDGKTSNIVYKEVLR
ncbi:uncharacterized protein LOC135950766 [Calliphora vicina]|uniref:uncharacterized protein LOC135950766 n=1 Tax=Calliphora vicina TaxID=7373 RepID=UPI00325A4BD5